jgi:glycosyltransferase
MRFSIITVSYNSAKTIEDTINSVNSQSYRDFEHLIIDGKSTDGTLELLTRYKNPKRRIISEDDKGLYDAMNKGIELSKGDYIIFLNADDYLAHAHALEIIAQDINDHSPDILMYSIEYFGEGIARKWILKNRKEVSPPESFVPPHPGFVMRVQSINRYNLTFDLNYEICADMKFMLEALQKSTLKKFASSRILTKMRKGGASSRNIVGRIKEFYRIYKDLGYPPHIRLILIIKRYWNRAIQQIS